MRHYIVYILFLLAATSCGLSEEPEIVGGESDVDLSFTLEIPEAVDENVGLKSYDDNSVRSIDLLVFDQDNKFLQRIQVNNISGTGATKTFSVRIPAVSQSRIFHIVANGRNQNNEDVVNFNSITANMLESAAITALKTKALAANTAPELPLVMWGRATLPSINSASTLGTINMLRTSAAIYVEYATATIVDELNDFSLLGFTITKTSDMGRVAPNAYTSPATTPGTVILPTGFSYIDYVNTSGVGAWAVAIGGKTGDLYAYERANILDNTGLSVIIRAQYKGVECYYKVWLKDNSGNVINIVRNHRYLIQITKVSGAGYATLNEAMSATYSANIFISIVDNNDDITDMVVDGKYELGVSFNAITLSGSGSKTIGVAFNTNPAATLSATSSVAWISSIQLTGSGERRTVTATLASTTTSRIGIITVRAGSLTRAITITQNP